jgi:hypothetical protein
LSGSAQETVELRLAETGTELGAAAEAAQFAQLISQTELDSPAEEHAVSRFVEAFATCVESWDGQPEVARRQALAGLSPRLAALEALGLFVHWGVVRRTVTTVAQGKFVLPVAILTIGRDQAPASVVLLPTELRAAADTVGPRH